MSDWVLEESCGGELAADFIQDKYWLDGALLDDFAEWQYYCGGCSEDPEEWTLYETGFRDTQLTANFLQNIFWEGDERIERHHWWQLGGGHSVESGPYSEVGPREAFSCRNDLVEHLANNESGESGSEEEEEDEEGLEEHSNSDYDE